MENPRVTSSHPPRSAQDPALVRGAENIVQRCLRVQPGERAVILAWHADEAVALMTRTLEQAGAVVHKVSLEPYASVAAGPRLIDMMVRDLGNAQVSLAIAMTDAPMPWSTSLIRAAQMAGTRHLHMTSLEMKFFEQSYRADPDVLDTINQRLVERMRNGGRLTTRSDAGTALTVTLSSQYPLVVLNGRPSPGMIDTLPTGMVFTHPATVDGVFVADRVLASPTVRSLPSQLRRTPVTFRIEQGRIVDVSSADADCVEDVKKYLTENPNAGRVGTVVLCTNYLVRSEIGNARQDALLPGLTVSFGYSASPVTRAPFDCPVQLRGVGRKHNVDIDGQSLVSQGRLAEALVAGIDPFR